jgi:hypothetical protein
MKSKGLGDTIEKFTTVTGIKKAVETIAEAVGIEDCGCNGRKKKLNNPKLIINKTFYKIN